MLEELEDIVPEWEQADWSLEWAQFMDILEYVLHKAYQSSQMTSQQKAQYKELLSKLKEVEPVLKKLDIAQLPVSVAESAHV